MRGGEGEQQWRGVGLIGASGQGRAAGRVRDGGTAGGDGEAEQPTLTYTPLPPPTPPSNYLLIH